MKIQKLQKQILKEEIQRRKKGSPNRIFLVLALVAILAVGGALYWKFHGKQRSLSDSFSKAQALVVSGDYEGAVQIFEAIIKEVPDSELAAAALFNKAEILNLYKEKYYDAVLIYLQVEKSHPKSKEGPTAVRQAARLLKNRLQDYARAVTVYQSILDRSPEDADQIRYELADSYFRINKFDQARIEFEGLLKDRPQSPLAPEALYRSGVTLALVGRHADAEQTFRRVMELYPDSSFAVEARFGLATALEEQEKLQASLDVLEKLQGVYSNPDVLQKKTEKVRERIRKKGRAI